MNAYVKNLFVQETVAAVRGLKSSTIASHLSDCVRAGLPLNVERLGITEAMQQLVLDTVRAPPINSGSL